MKTKSKWLLIVFVAFLQVAMLLLVEIGMFGWFRNQASEVLTQRAFNENRALLDNLETQLTPATQETDAAWLKHLTDAVNSSNVPDGGYLSISDKATGELLVPSDSEFASSWDSDRSNWLDTVSNKLDDRKNGLATFNSELQLITVWQMDDRPFVCAVHRPHANVMAASENLLSMAHRLCFGLVLLMGLVTTLLIYSILIRFKNGVAAVTEDLQRGITERAEELEKTKNAVIYGLAKLAESRDNDTGEHLDRIRSYVTILAKDLRGTYPEVDDEFIDNLSIASSLHDIGKVGIPDSILLKPGRLSAKERGIMEMHSVIGGECLEAIQARLGDNEFMKIATQVAYSHHERWDGTGYPYGLADEEIPLVARIVSVADVYDALTSKRPYKKAMSHTESRAIIVAGSGSQFDPEIVASFLRHEDEFEMISVKQQFVKDEDATSSFQKLAEAVAAQTEEERNTLA